MAAIKNLQREKFCHEYLIDFNATQAAIRAGYAVKAAKSQGQRLLTFDDVKGRLAELAKDACKNADITKDKVLNEIVKLAFANIKNIFNERGQLKAISELPDDIAAMISSIEVVTQNVPNGESIDVQYVSKIKLWDKKGSLELLGKYLKLFTENHVLSNPDGSPISQTPAINVNFVTKND